MLTTVHTPLLPNYHAMHLQVVEKFAPFVVGYIHSAQKMMLEKGWRPGMANVVCTGTEAKLWSTRRHF